MCLVLFELSKLLSKCMDLFVLVSGSILLLISQLPQLSLQTAHLAFSLLEFSLPARILPLVKVDLFQTQFARRT